MEFFLTDNLKKDNNSGYGSNNNGEISSKVLPAFVDSRFDAYSSFGLDGSGNISFSDHWPTNNSETENKTTTKNKIRFFFFIGKFIIYLLFTKTGLV